MDVTHSNGSSSDEGFSNTENVEKHRHSSIQVQQLEKVFEFCPNPTEVQREHLARDLGLAPRQIRFWFQNKRNQIRIQNDKASNFALREENARILSENVAMKESINNYRCPRCSGFNLDDDVVARQQAVERLRLENALLRQEYQRLLNILGSFRGKSGL